MIDNLSIFRKEFLEANTWDQRKNGVPLDLLDNLSIDELKIAETELINSLSLNDDWPITGLGHIRSSAALPGLYSLLDKSGKAMKVIIAHAIFQICQDPKMIDRVLEEMPKITNQYELIYTLHKLTIFKDQRIIKLLNNYCGHQEYLVAYNATRTLGLSTDEVVKKFRNKNKKKSLWKKLFGK